MEKTRRSFSDRLNEFLADFREIDEDFFEDLEETLFLQTLFEMTLGITDALRDEVRLKMQQLLASQRSHYWEDGRHLWKRRR